MSTRRLLFLAGLVAVPALTWIGSIESSLERRVQARQRLAQIDAVRVQNRRTVSERDSLRGGWDAFKPLADEKLDKIELSLNPLLIQSNVVDLARRMGLEVDIRQEAMAQPGRPPSWYFQGISDYRRAIEFLLELENSALRVRFDKVEVSMVADPQRGNRGDVRFHAWMTIPTLPESATARPGEEKVG